MILTRTTNTKVVVGMDVASSEFLMPDGRYDLDFKNKGGDQQLTGEELGQLYKDLAAKYPIVSIEDPFDQDDWANYAPFTAAVGENVQVVGDDLLVTNPSRILEAGEKKACNALLLKVCSICAAKLSLFSGCLSSCHSSIFFSSGSCWVCTRVGRGMLMFVDGAATPILLVRT